MTPVLTKPKYSKFTMEELNNALQLLQKHRRAKKFPEALKIGETLKKMGYHFLGNQSADLSNPRVEDELRLRFSPKGASLYGFAFFKGNTLPSSVSLFQRN